MKSYKVHSMFATLQGEGYWAGRRAVFLRFAGCNLWSGLDQDRSKGPGSCSAWCDTYFVGGMRMSAVDVARTASDTWGPGREHRFVVLTGGEPTLQVDWDLVAILHRHDFMVAMETNGTREVDPLTDWITVSPKAGAELVQRRGHELKLVYPQPGAEPDRFAGLDFKHRFLQPMDGPDREANTQAAADYCLAHPEWRLSIQMHKVVGLP